MASNRSKYSEDFRESVVSHVMDANKSATCVAEEMGIDTNTVCRWVREYKRKHNLPSYKEEKGIIESEPKSNKDLLYRNKALERELKKKDRTIAEEREKIEILKKSLHIFMQPQE